MKTTFKKSILFIAMFAAFAMIITGCSKSKDSAATSIITKTTCLMRVFSVSAGLYERTVYPIVHRSS